MLSMHTRTPPNSGIYALNSDQHRHLIRESHGRSLSFGLDSWVKPDFSPLNQRGVEHARVENHMLYQHASPVMETLYEQIANTHSMVLLTSSNGLILHSLGDADFLEKATQVALMPGVEWSEQSRGTNAIGTALTEGQPVVVHGRDHFLQSNQFLTCSCTPIFDPYGKVMGALDVTGDERSYHQHTMALVRMSAQMIENHMFENVFPDAMRIHFHSRPEFLNTLVEGIVVFTLDGRFLSANRSAQFQLGLSVNAMKAHTFSSLFNLPVSQFHDRLRHSAGQPVSLCMHNGVSVFCQARLKSSSAWFGGLHHAPSSAPSPQPKAYPNKPASVTPEPTPATRATTAAAAGRASLSSLHYLNTGDPQIAAVLHKLQRVQGSDIPIMILGETGTGKDILAQAIHNDSARARQPFVSINCASIPETLIESELFGYEEGAFTGAKRRGAPGKIQMAHGGTLFLDEIGDMPTQLQARLLRVLQERRVTPLGSGKEYDVDVMLICATNKNLKTLIAQNQFREDLYYRLNGLVVRLPALRERSDFEIVANKILFNLCEEDHKIHISDEVMALFLQYRWPGNFRQLHNLLRTAVVMVGHSGGIGMEHLPDDFLEEVQQAPVRLQPEPLPCEEAALVMPLSTVDAHPPVAAESPLAAPGGVTAPWSHRPPQAAPPQPMAAAAPTSAGAPRLQDVALQTMTDALRQCRGNVSAAAKLLGVSRNTIYRKKDHLPPDVWD
ncbi:sigma-54-dependent Fis family transcriptional regulator [Limnohabitans sp. Bal53]|uniref:sigma-54-dependent Fis family transcriptional regulator n=1 Tax=Limnohabitans sp. Bal53 TaxID=1977910 RepID=UPI00268A2496